MNRYQSHEIVEAGRITSMEATADILNFDVGIEGEDEPYRITKTEGERIMRMATDVGLQLMDGHLMLYNDGYVSWSPHQAFTEGYDLVQPSSGKTKIAGYRELNELEFVQINNIKDHGKQLGAVVEYMRSQGDYDQRWVSIGATHLQEGLSALSRAVAKPDFF